MDRVSGLLGLPLVNRHPNIAFFGGTVIIAIMVMAAVANVANAGGLLLQQVQVSRSDY